MSNGNSLLIGISGASGFIGRNLTNFLNAQGDQVLELSRSIDTGLVSISNKELIKTCDTFVHLGEPANINQTNRSGVIDHDPTSGFLDFLVNEFGPRLLYASSAAVYGTNSLNPHKVTEGVHSYDAYTEMKIKHEEMVLSEGGRILRLSNIFGPGMSHETVMYRLRRQIQEGAPISVGLNSIRDYLYIDEVVRAIFLTIGKDSPLIMNIGSGCGRSISDLIDSLSQVLRIQVSLAGDEGMQGNLDCSILDIAATTEALDWVPNLDFEGQLSRIFGVKGF